MWISVKIAASLSGYTESAIRSRAKRDEYIFQYIPPPPGKGGKPRMQILLESLSEKAQRAYYNQVNGDTQFVVNTDYTSTIEQKRKGDQRALVLTEYRQFEKEARKGGMTRKGDILSEFLSQWNNKHPEFKVTVRQFYDWRKKKKSGKSLVDKRGGYNRGQCSIPQKYQELFESYYLQESKRSIESCYRDVKMVAQENNDQIPGIKAFHNYVKNMDKATVKRWREGKKSFEDNCVPSAIRHYSVDRPNERWVSDHHLWDVFVRVPDGKGGWKLDRPWGTYWMDIRTRKVMSFVIRTESPNSDVVMHSFGIGIKKFGVPEEVLLDNGKDYKAYDMFYTRDEQDRVRTSLATNLQIGTIYARPYNGKAKPIERMFNTFEEQFGKRFASYAGRDAKQRPEDLKDLNIMDVVTLEEFIELHNKYVEDVYNESPHSGDAMNRKSPNQVYSEIPFNFRSAPEGVLHFCLMRVKGLRKVGKNGIVFNGVYFYADEFCDHWDETVIAKYNPDQPERLYIFDTNENFLFEASKLEMQPWGDHADYQEENRRKKVARQRVAKAHVSSNATRTPEAIRGQLERLSDSLGHTEITKPQVIEPIRNEKMEENARRISMSDMERNYEDVIKRNNEKKKAVSERQRELADKFKQKMLDRAYGRQA